MNQPTLGIAHVVSGRNRRKLLLTALEALRIGRNRVQGFRPVSMKRSCSVHRTYHLHLISGEGAS